ncbi:hypothetical protein ACFQ3P_39025 [Paraburkholderia sabiae]|uniref:Uncharacterized protein n=1 Tax=Paraburkholderia sabiae TaxID=273251 RepID=A0ABU9QR01_9BURK|nr:hypothetical protein [Paraburkholderia sabiae]WJZ79724.1 hypothetical protein QEN71_42060 [Paraburkholderia sabiae]
MSEAMKGTHDRIADHPLGEWKLVEVGFNRWMQHTETCSGSGSVADETATPDLLQRDAESVDVGALAEG